MVSPEETIERGLRNLRELVVEVFRSSKRFKIFPMRWKWRRTRVYHVIMTVIVITVFLVSIFPTVTSSILISDFDKSKQNYAQQHQRLKTILDDLTSTELKQIFGSSNPSNVPILDIVKPKFLSGSRRRRSVESLKSESAEKVIQLQGFGRNFRMTLRPNPSLLNLNEFVHLFRRDNYSEILPDQIVKSQLQCFHHGTVSHHSMQKLAPGSKVNKSRHLDHTDIKNGLLALDTCNNGLKGLIVPVENDPEHHYVIHPVPNRFRTLNNQNNEQHATTRRNRDELPEHFIWKRQSVIGRTSADKHVRYPQSRYSTRPQPQSTSESFCGHDDSENARRSQRSMTSENSQGRQRSTTHENPQAQRRPMTSGDLSSRVKRSQLTFDDEESLEQQRFRYKPRNVAVDSYWLRHRSITTPLDDYYPSSSQTHSYSHAYGHRTASDNHGRHAHRTGHFTQKQPSSDYWTPTKGVSTYDAYDIHRQTLVNDAQQNSPAVPRNDDLDRSGTSYRPTFPFYTNAQTYGALSDSPSRWPSSSGSLDDQYYYYNSSGPLNPTTRQATSQGHLRAGHFHSRSKAIDDRKGRGDNTIFGEPYHSSLDSDLMTTAQSTLAQTRVVKDMEPAHLTIETAVFVDKDLYEHMQANFPDDTQAEVSRIVLAMVNAVQLLYQDPSLGHRVEFVLKRLEILATDPPGLVRPYDIDHFLTNFCKWQKTENPASDADPLHWDHALILTGLDLYVVHQSRKVSHQVVGLAPVAGMCTRSSSCTVNEGRHFESVYVMAHEIGHNLGMRHDGPQADNECDPTAHLMSPTLGSGKITWSSCSKRYLDMFLETPQSKCLLDKAKSETRLDHDADCRLPGERFNADQQCVLKYGRGSFHATQQPMEDVCRDLHCRKQYYTWTSHPALEGTECGLDMSCRAGKCVSKSQLNDIGQTIALDGSLVDHGGQLSNHLGNMDGSETAAYSTLKALDGAWGKWSPFTDCSSACLYSDDGGVVESSTGIRLAARRCDSPRPENGGRQCSGLDRRYKMCTTEKICPSTLARTSTAHYANEVCARAASADTELSGRGFMSTNTNDPERACSVWCEISQGMGSRSRGWSFPDGTACKLNSIPRRSNFCVAGKCQEFTCNASSHFSLSDELCSVPAKPSSDQSSWFANRGTGLSSSDGTYRQEKAFWTKWEPQSTCKLTCIAPSKGLQLVQRKCNLDSSDEGGCTGLALSVRLCKPDKSTILSSACPRLQTVIEHATKLCTKYSEKVAGLSGIGMQLSPTKDDSHRPCRIGCQDAALPYRFYMVNGEEGWFPAGTECSRGEPNKKAFCLSGKCIDFGPDDTPIYRINAKVLGRLESFLRTKRYVSDDAEHSVMDQGSLQKLIEDFAASQSDIEFPEDLGKNLSDGNPVLDFGRPVVVYDMAQDHQNPEIFDDANEPLKSSTVMEVEGGFYEWRKVLSDCSASCGKGVREVIVQCVSSGTPVADSFCVGQEKPGTSAYTYCHLRPCTQLDLQMEQSHNFLWSWIQSILPHRNNLS